MLRTTMVIMSLIMPIIFISAGILIAKTVFTDGFYKTYELFFQLVTLSGFLVIAFCFSSSNWGGTLVYVIYIISLKGKRNAIKI